MSNERLTILVIVGTTVVLVLYDIVAAMLRGQGATISVVITKYSQTWPAIPFAFGLLMGHFFLQNSGC